LRKTQLRLTIRAVEYNFMDIVVFFNVSIFEDIVSCL
jgi:hypothetical protein